MAHVVAVGAALDLLEAGHETEDLVLVGLQRIVEQVHELVDGLLVSAGHHVEKSAPGDVASGRETVADNKLPYFIPRDTSKVHLNMPPRYRPSCENLRNPKGMC